MKQKLLLIDSRYTIVKNLPKMKDKYWYKIDFSKATKSLAQSISKHFHVWDNLLLNSQIIKYKVKN